MDRAPFIQSTEQNATYFILFSMTFAILNYLRYAKSVIWQMCVSSRSPRPRMLIPFLCSTDFTGIACFTVRHKDAQGGWVDNDQATEAKKGR